jgi:hypothetical protein
MTDSLAQATLIGRAILAASLVRSHERTRLWSEILPEAREISMGLWIIPGSQKHCFALELARIVRLSLAIRP